MALEDLLLSESESDNSVTDSDSAESDSDEDLIQEGYNTLNLLDSLDAMDKEDEARNSSTIIRRHRLQRDRIDTGTRLYNDYFSDNPTFPGDYFRNRYRMSKSLFIRIGHAILSYDSQPRPDYFKYFDQRYDATGQLGFNIFQKCTSAIRQLAYGIAPDALDEKPSEEDVRRLHAKYLEMHGFPAGSNNDINVLNELDLLEDLLDGQALEVRYTIDGHKFTKRYYLVDDIYSEWATLVKLFKCPFEPKNVKFKRFQEAARKDVERAFGVLQGRWAILKHPARLFSINKIRRIIYTCVILHNMITEDNERNICDLEEDYLRERENMPRRTWTERVELQDRVDREMRDKRAHHVLRNNLIEHIWTLPDDYIVRNN
ncbi:uncharacterized protein [Rutidosis leptorrhynchoides]|uniref:uncharacterized protein n=1 Tax=Rutidosis leptorrhynchoides TaxID=125765 RepID=UPI003A99445A